MNLLILGAGGHGHVVKETAEAIGCYDDIAFLDDHSDEAIGTLADHQRLSDEYQAAFPAFGDNKLREEWFKKLSTVFEIPTLIHPKAYVSPSARIGAGTIVESMACINSRVVIGTGCILSISTVIDHDCQIGNFSHIDCGVILKPRSHVETYSVIKQVNEKEH